jgi:hypothetical protein
MWGTTKGLRWVFGIFAVIALGWFPDESVAQSPGGVAAITQALQARGWLALQPEARLGRRLPYLGADQVFLNARLDQVLMVRLGKVAWTEKHPRFAQGALLNGTPFTVFLHGLGQAQEVELKGWLESTLPTLQVAASEAGPGALQKLWDRTIPSACATEPCAEPNCLTGTGWDSQLAKALMGPAGGVLELVQPQLFETVKGCVVLGVEGAWQNTVGTVVGGAKTIWDTVRNPALAARQLSDQAQAVADFFQKLGPNLSSLWEAAKSLPAEQARDLICQMIGAIGADALVAALLAPESGGASLAVMAAKMTSYFNKALRVLPILKNIANIADGSKEMIQVAIRKLSKVNDVDLKRAEVLEQNGFSRLAGAVLSCSI